MHTDEMFAVRAAGQDCINEQGDSDMDKRTKGHSIHLLNPLPHAQVSSLNVQDRMDAQY